MTTSIRRIVTGELPDGRSIFTHIEDVEPVHPGGDAVCHVVWAWPAIPALPCLDPQLTDSTIALPEQPGEMKIVVWTLPPGFPRTGAHPDAGRMHSTDTVDVLFILEGEMRLRQADDDREVTLRRGDVLVQNGTLHEWTNASDEPCVLAYVFFGATRTQAA